MWICSQLVVLQIPGDNGDGHRWNWCETPFARVAVWPVHPAMDLYCRWDSGVDKSAKIPMTSSSMQKNPIQNTKFTVIGNSWGVGPDGVGGLGLGPQEHFRYKMMMISKYQIKYSRACEVRRSTEKKDWMTKTNTKQHFRACADISIGGSVIVLPTLPPPTIPVATG